MRQVGFIADLAYKKDMESRKTTGLAAIDLLAALATERDAAANAAKESGLSPKAFAVTGALRDEPSLKAAGIGPKEVGRNIEALKERFPNAHVNADEQRRLRASLYRPLLKIPTEERTRIVDLIVGMVLS
jgi:type I restriction enzyme, R subunit